MKNIVRILLVIWFLAGFCASAYMYYYAYFVDDIKQWPTEAIPFIYNNLWLHIIMIAPIALSAGIQFVVFWLIVIWSWIGIISYTIGLFLASIGFIFTGDFYIDDLFDIFGIQN